jgi:hypothetical protein
MSITAKLDAACAKMDSITRCDADEPVRIGQLVHLGLATKGGAGFTGRVTEILNGTVTIEAPNPTGVFSKTKTYKGPLSRVSRA